MTIQPVSDLKTPIGDILQAAGSECLLLETGSQTRYAIIPLDDYLIDYLLERSLHPRPKVRRRRLAILNAFAISFRPTIANYSGRGVRGSDLAGGSNHRRVARPTRSQCVALAKVRH